MITFWIWLPGGNLWHGLEPWRNRGLEATARAQSSSGAAAGAAGGGGDSSPFAASTAAWVPARASTSPGLSTSQAVGTETFSPHPEEPQHDERPGEPAEERLGDGDHRGSHEQDDDDLQRDEQHPPGRRREVRLPLRPQRECHRRQLPREAPRDPDDPDEEGQREQGRSGDHEFLRQARRAGPTRSASRNDSRPWTGGCAVHAPECMHSQVLRGSVPVKGTWRLNRAFPGARARYSSSRWPNMRRRKGRSSVRENT